MMMMMMMSSKASSAPLQQALLVVLYLWLGIWGSIIITGACEAAPLDDLIKYLPDFGHTPTPHYSGYLDATAGCNTDVNGNYCKLHYWLALAEGENPFDKPVVLWLNGGPGSSSLFGFFQENGPLLINVTGGLMKNPYAWTKLANILALEAPVGVGYSYCAKQIEEDDVCQNTDKYTASASRAALQDFFVNKFPELASSDFFITGESYAGIYIPTLSKEILDHAAHDINVVGIAVGDPCTDNTAQRDAMDSLWYSNKNGLVDEQVYDLLWNNCSARFPNLMNQGGKHLVASKLNRHLLLEFARNKSIQSSNQSGKHDQDKLDDMASYAKQLLAKLSSDGGPSFDQENEACTLAMRKFLLSSSHALSQSWSDLYIDDYSLFAPVTTKQEEDMAVYMMRADVRAALHVQDAPTTSWPYANVGFDYTSEYDACNANVPEEGAWSMIDFYKDICPRLDITFVFNGDTDPCVSYEGTRTAVKRIGFEELDGGSYRPWFYNQTAASLKVLAEKPPLFGPNLLAQSVGAQMGGEVVNYKHGLSFLTVHGSGHMVPQFRPQAALNMLDKLLQKGKTLLSPLLPSNQTLLNMGHDEFKKVMHEWTESAMAEPYVASNSNNQHDTPPMTPTIKTTASQETSR